MNQTTERFGTRLLSWIMALAMVLTMLPAAALAADDTPSQTSNPKYVLMNIPYEDFYAAEKGDSDTVSTVDAITSSTKQKTTNETLAAGSYHVNNDGSDITGITYPVKVEDASTLNTFTKVDSKDALFHNASWSYYELTEDPASFKTLTVSGSTKSLSKASAAVTTDSDATATLSTSDRHADYAISVKNLDGVTTGATNVSAVTLHTTDNNVYGLRHVYEIWRGTELGFNVTGDNGDYAALVGKTIDKITYYLNDGKIISFNTELKILPKAAVTAAVQSVDAGTASTSFTLSGSLPTDFNPVYSVNLAGASVNSDNNTISLPEDAAFGAYTLTITDQNGTYAPVTANFSLYGYLLMNIPYADFYAAEKDKNDTVSAVDAITSATKTKTKSTLAAGSYHVDNDGSDITGITYPVQVSDASVLSGFTQVTDTDSFTYTLKLRGQEVTTTYTGKDALFNKPSYSYYVLSEKPETYKTLMVRRGTKSFGAATASAKELTGAAVTLSTTDRHADIALIVTQAEDNAPIQADNVSGVTLHTTDNNVYGLRHVYEIWRGTELGFNLADANGNDDHKALADKTIDRITYYLKDGSVYTIPVNLYVAALDTYTVDGTTSTYKESGKPTFNWLNSKLTSDTKLFPNGADDAYLVTIGDETNLLGDTSLKRWEGTWESWQPWTAADSTTMKNRYPLIDDVWEQAYPAYINMFEQAGMGAKIKQMYPDVASLKKYWNDMTGTNDVATIKVENNKITWLNSIGTELASDTYTMTGKVLNGLEGAKMYVFTADTLDNSSTYKYFVTMQPDMEGEETTPIAAHYHFQFGSDLTKILAYGAQHNAFATDSNGKKQSDMVNKTWYATMINANASDLAKYNVVLSMHKADKFSTEGDVLSGIAGENGTTYAPLFDCILKDAYKNDWHDYVAAILGADNENLDATVEALRESCNGTKYGENNVPADNMQFYCGFLPKDETISVNGSTITVKTSDGNTVSHDYIYQGTAVMTGTMAGQTMSIPASLYMTTDADAGNYKYFLFREDTPDETYHIEFRYGDSLDALKAYTTGKYAFWQAAGIPENADAVMIQNCIALFALENMDYSADRTETSKAQIADFTGTWDYYANGAAQHDTLYFTIDANGQGASFLNGQQASAYQAYAYNTDANSKSGIYVSRNEDGELIWADYAITVSGGKTFLTLTGYEGSTPYSITYVKHTSSASSGSSSSGGGSSSSSVTNSVSASAASNGKVTLDKASAKKGDTVTITVTPNDGYTLDKLTVTDAKGNAIAVTKKGDGKYSFTMPAYQVSVKAEFAASSAASDTRFADVAANAYYADAVAWAAEKGITGGTTATTFSPNAGCTRAQMVTFLWRAAGSPKAKSSANPFADVPTDAYYYDAVLWAVENGITSGASASAFDPDGTCTRAHAVMFLWRAEASPAAASSSAFADVAGSDYYASAVQWAAAAGITSGTSASTFSPAASCTRAQIVTFLYRNAAD